MAIGSACEPVLQLCDGRSAAGAATIRADRRRVRFGGFNASAGGARSNFFADEPHPANASDVGS